MPLKLPSDPCAIAVWATTAVIVLKSGLRITPQDMLSCGDGSLYFQHKMTEEERAELSSLHSQHLRCISPGTSPASADASASPRPSRVLPFGRRVGDSRPPLRLEAADRETKEA
jgi:hypothetical protein